MFTRNWWPSRRRGRERGRTAEFGGKPPLGSTAESHLCAEPDQHYTLSLEAAKPKESMMGRWCWPAAAALAIVACGAECSAQSLISKKYVLDRAQSDDVFRVITDAVHAPSVEWPDLRRRLYKSSLPTNGFRMTSIAGQISVNDDTPRPIIHVMVGGESMKWKINDGQIIDVSAKSTGEAVAIVYRGRDYERTTVYSNVGEQLVAETTITGPIISTPIRYRLVYK